MKQVLSWSLSLLLGLVFSTGCSRRLGESELPRPSSRLAGSTQAFPGIVKITGQKLCTGSVVGPSTVLTAAHCVQSGPVSIETPQGILSSSDILLLGSGIEGDVHDLALVYLPTPFRSSADILPLASGVSSGDTVFLVGFGCASSENPGTSGVKRFGANVVSNVTDFIELTTPGLQIRGISGPENRAGVCFGDSGGPLLKNLGGRWVVVGVIHGAYNENPGQISQIVNLNLSENRNFLSQYVR